MGQDFEDRRKEPPPPAWQNWAFWIGGTAALVFLAVSIWRGFTAGDWNW